jgi:hypothetical protein
MEERILLYPCYGYLNTRCTENDEDEWVILNAIKLAAKELNHYALEVHRFLLG